MWWETTAITLTSILLVAVAAMTLTGLLDVLDPHVIDHCTRCHRWQVTLRAAGARPTCLRCRLRRRTGRDTVPARHRAA